MKISFPLLTLSISIVLLWSCDKGLMKPTSEQYEEVLEMGGDFDPFPEFRTVDTLSTQAAFDEDREGEDPSITERWVCTTSTIDVLDGNGQFPLFDANAEVIYPGNLLQGNSLSNNPPSPIVVKRAGGTISYDLNNGNLASSFYVEEVDKSSIQDGMNNIIAEAKTSGNDLVPANFNLEITQVQSESQLALELGIQVETYQGGVSANMGFSTDQTYNRFLVKLTQKYYTMSFDLPTSLDEVFHESVTPEQLSGFVGEDNPGTFISSVTYGRIFYMLVESTSSSQQMSAQLSGTYGSFGNKVGGEVGVDAYQSLENARTKVIAYGGTSGGSFSLTGLTDIQQIATQLEASTDIGAGLPLSYVVRSIERPDQIVGTTLATSYDVTECELKGILPPATYKPLVDLFEDGYGAALEIKGATIALFNKAGDQYVLFNAVTSEISPKYDVTNTGGPLGLTTLSNIGAAVRHNDNRLYLFSENGLQLNIISYNPDAIANNTLPTTPIGALRENSDDGSVIYFTNELYSDTPNFQFLGRGFSAATRIGGSVIQFFGNPGNEWARYGTSGGGSWGNPVIANKLDPVEGNTVPQSPFNRIQAATRVLFSANHRYLYINEAGDQLIERVSTPIRAYNGPWVIN